MTYLLALIAALAGAAVGFAIGALAGTFLAPALGISGFEGAAGHFVMFICGPIGGLIGMILASVLVLRRRGHRAFGAIASRFVLVVAGIGLLTAGGLTLLYLSGDVLNPNGAAPQLVFEVKLPSGMAPPAAERDFRINLSTSKNQMPGTWSATRLADGRTVVAGSVELYYRTSQRFLELRLPNGTDMLFQLKLSAGAPHGAELSRWYPVDYVGEAGKDRTRRPTAAEAFEVRYRASWPDRQ